MVQTKSDPNSNDDLIELAHSLVTIGPHKMEKTTRRVRGQFDNHWLFDTTCAYHVWEHPYYPQYYIPLSDLEDFLIIWEGAIDDDASVSLASVKRVKSGEWGAGTLERVLVFKKGELEGLARFEFTRLDAWYEEDQQIYGHPKDPYKRIDVLPSSRKITVKVGDVVVAESTLNMFLFETMLRTRYYMPKTAGTAEYYNLNVYGQEIKDAIWWYRYPTHESAPIAGMVCFYNEKVDVFVDGVKEDK
ncbi:MAG: hypothetical protein Q9218_001178 [Villophora microphyllina]